MDLITQALLGAAIGELAAGRQLGNRAVVAGALSGVLPDMDILFLPLFGELQRISIHRGFSHSIIFSLFAGILLAAVMKRWPRWNEITYVRRLVLFFSALSTHILLDSFTTYGTQLFLPFKDIRVSLDSISIVDPVYTIPLICGLILTLIRRNRSLKPGHWNLAGLLFSSLYLIFTLFHKASIEQIFIKSYTKQGTEIIDLLTVPVSFGNIHWYGVVKSRDSLFIGDYSVFDVDKSVYFKGFPINEHLLEGLDPRLVDRMKWFSKDFYSVVSSGESIRVYNLQCDMQGIQQTEYTAPTAYYFEIESNPEGTYKLSSGMHRSKLTWKDKWRRIRGNR